MKRPLSTGPYSAYQLKRFPIGPLRQVRRGDLLKPRINLAVNLQPAPVVLADVFARALELDFHLVPIVDVCVLSIGSLVLQLCPFAFLGPIQL